MVRNHAGNNEGNTGQHEAQAVPGKLIETFDGGFGIMRDARTAKPQNFRTGDDRFTFNLTTNLAEME